MKIETEWTFKLSEDEKNTLELNNKRFFERVNESNLHQTAFDYSIDISYEECCDDIKSFVIQTMNRFLECAENKKEILKEFFIIQKLFDKKEETKNNLISLIKLCEQYRLSKHIVRYFYHSVHYTLNRDYKNATDQYMRVILINRSQLGIMHGPLELQW